MCDLIRNRNSKEASNFTRNTFSRTEGAEAWWRNCPKLLTNVVNKQSSKSWIFYGRLRLCTLLASVCATKLKKFKDCLEEKNRLFPLRDTAFHTTVLNRLPKFILQDDQLSFTTSASSLVVLRQLFRHSTESYMIVGEIGLTLGKWKCDVSTLQRQNMV